MPCLCTGCDGDILPCSADRTGNHAVKPDTKTTSVLRGQQDKINPAKAGDLLAEARLQPHLPVHDAGEGVHDTIVVQYASQLGRCVAERPDGLIFCSQEGLKQRKKVIIVVAGVKGFIKQNRVVSESEHFCSVVQRVSEP